MSTKPNKTRQTTISASKLTSQATTEPKASEEGMLMASDFEGFKRELRDELVGVLKREVRAVLESELGLFKTEVLALKSDLEKFKTNTSSDLATLRSTLTGAEQSWSTCSDDITTLQHEVKRLTELTDDLQKKYDDLEGRSRRNNVRIIGIPESPGSCSTSEVSGLLKEAFKLDKAPLIDRSHRTFQAAPEEGKPPRTVIACLHYYQDCNKILRLARSQNKIKVRDMAISVFPDYTARVAKKRAAFRDVKQTLKALPDVKFGLNFPAKLRITFKGVESFFTDPDTAMTYVEQTILRREDE